MRMLSFFRISLFLLPLLSTHVMAEEKILTFGIVPQQSASKLARSWGPVMSYIRNHSGIELRFKTAPNIPDFEERLARGEYDFAYMNPYHYVVFSETPGYRAMAKARDKQIKGIMVTHKDSAVTTLEDLVDKEIAFPSPAAFAASILPRAELKKLGVQITPKYVSSHDSVYRNVASGLVVAGGGVKRTFNAFEAEQQKQLKIFWTSKGYTPHAIASHPDIEADTVNAVKAALVSMETTDTGREILTSLKIKGWQEAADNDWNDVRELNIPDLENPLK